MNVVMEFECGCFKRSGYESVQEFRSEQEAVERAEDMIADMNESFCGAHRFGMRHEPEQIVITVKSNF